MEKQLMCVFIGMALSWVTAVAQIPRNCPTQLTLMVVPYTEANESIDEKIKIKTYQRAIDIVSQSFKDRKYSVRDFMERYEKQKIERIVGQGTQTSLVKMVIENAPVDVLIRAEIFLETNKEGDHQAKIRLNAVDKYSTEFYAGTIKLMESSIRRHDDYNKYVQEALDLDSSLYKFCNKLDSAILFVQQNGRTMQIKVELDDNSLWKLDTKIGQSKEQLSDEIESWTQRNLASGQVRFVGKEENVLILEARVPVLNALCQSQTPNNFGKELRKHLSNLPSSRGEMDIKDTIIGGQIYLRIK
jgi:Family of unknown function (DUF6175)